MSTNLQFMFPDLNSYQIDLLRRYLVKIRKQPHPGVSGQGVGFL